MHVAGGMYALIFVLAMALTGLTWSFDWYRTAFYAVCGVEHTPRNFGQPKSSSADKNSLPQESLAQEGRGEGRGEGRNGHRGEGRGRRGGGHRSEFGRWQQVYDELNEKYPDAPQITIGSETATVTLSNSGNSRASDKYDFNRRSGEITPSIAYTDSKEADKLRGWIYSIHTGSLGGLFTRILWLLGALLGASLPLTGYYIWIKHLGKKKAN